MDDDYINPRTLDNKYINHGTLDNDYIHPRTLDNDYINPRTLDDDYEDLNGTEYDDIVRGSLFRRIEDGTLGYGSISAAPDHWKCIPKWTR